ncbi:MAG: hypothetical protein RLZZ480_75 [Candidatus Parcubacteria bacterium]|jgi:hypothetical protein
MSQKTIILTVVLFALIVVGMFMYAKLRSSETKSSFNDSGEVSLV